MTSKKSIASTFRLGMVLTTLLCMAILGSLWIANQYMFFLKEAEAIQRDALQLHKDTIRGETERAVSFLNYKKAQTEQRLMDDIRQRTHEAHAIAMSLYTTFAAEKSPQEMAQLIRETLRSIRFNQGRGYFFATRLDGVEMLFADRPELEGQNLLEMQDTQGRFVIKEMIALARTAREGFYRYTWTKPNELGRDFPKIAHIIYFQPLDWFIGTGEYLDDVTRDIQAEVLDRFAQAEPVGGTYLFAGQYNGLSLLGPQKGNNMLEVRDVNGVPIVSDLIDAARRGGDYVQYVMPAFAQGDVAYPKLSFALGIPEWQWYVGAGVDLAGIESVIATKKAALKKQMVWQVLQIVAILAVLLGGALSVAYYFETTIRKSFGLFTAFFSQASTTAAKIDPDHLHFRECALLAHSANRMIDERDQIMKKVTENEEKYRLLVENSNDAIFIIQGGVIAFCNSKTVELTARTPQELASMPFSDLIHPEDRALVLERHNLQLAGDATENAFSFRVLDNQGGILWVHLNATPTTWDNRPATINFLRDITPQKQLEEQLQQAHKMEAIGTLAGGIAHDFNNILGAIMGFAEMALYDTPEHSPVRASLEQVLKASHRAKDLVRQILAFSRQNEQEKKPVHVLPVVKEVLTLLRATLPATIDIRQHLDPQAGVINADPIQIHQVVMNLCTNAYHAMRGGGGILQIDLRREPVGDHHPELPAGDYLKLTVTDNGEGIPPAILNRIFDPYFTTKDKGVGTGMGLAVVHGIVRDHGGAISVRSTPGQGSSFDICLPRIALSPVEAPRHSIPLSSGTEHILVVDDEEVLVRVMERMLRRLGYSVTTFTHPVHAMEAFRSQPDKFALLISDMTMPGMTGDTMARDIKTLRPDFPVILCTGYSEKKSEAALKKLGVNALMLKPVVLKDLSETVRRVLDSLKQGASM